MCVRVYAADVGTIHVRGIAETDRAADRARSTMRNLFEKRLPGSEFVDGYWILASFEVSSENRSVFQKAF